MPLKRYTVVMVNEENQYNSESPYSDVFVEYYSAEDYGHAEEQAKDANEDVIVIRVTRDPTPNVST